jgi:hypothetical protein
MRRIVFLLLLAAAPALAAQRAGVTLPDTAEVAGKTLQLNGLGVREATMFNVKVYVAGLYVAEKSSDPDKLLGSDQPWRLVMKFTRDVEREKMTEAFDEGFEKNGVSSALKPRLAKLKGMMTDVKEGQTIVLTYEPGKGLSVSEGGAPKGTIEGADFARAVLQIWLGPNPPNEGLKTGLLGKG